LFWHVHLIVAIFLELLQSSFIQVVSPDFSNKVEMFSERLVKALVVRRVEIMVSHCRYHGHCWHVLFEKVSQVS
jgi:hypothetical protein